MNENYPIRMKLTVKEIGIRQRVEGKPYERMDFEADGDKAGTNKLECFTFSPDVMDHVVEGKTFEADLFVEKGKCKVEKVVQPDREMFIHAQTAVNAVARMRAGNIKLPEGIILRQEALIKKWLIDAVDGQSLEV